MYLWFRYTSRLKMLRVQSQGKTLEFNVLSCRRIQILAYLICHSCWCSIKLQMLQKLSYYSQSALVSLRYILRYHCPVDLVALAENTAVDMI